MELSFEGFDLAVRPGHPVILGLGRELHPEKPYQDPRVTVHVDDARSFLRNTGRKYDLIVYGLLDSHTMLSSMSSVRLDSFVYTVDGFREARSRLKPDGIIALGFTVHGWVIATKLHRMLQQPFDGEPPRVYRGDYDQGLTYFAGPGVSGAAALAIGQRVPVVFVPDQRQMAHGASPLRAGN